MSSDGREEPCSEKIWTKFVETRNFAAGRREWGRLGIKIDLEFFILGGESCIKGSGGRVKERCLLGK